MNSIIRTHDQFQAHQIDKPTFIQRMFEQHHAKLFDYAAYLNKTNIKKIEIEGGEVIMTSRDRGVRIACSSADYRIAPIETLNFFDYEKDESAMMERLISDGDTFFDIGANIGWYAINIGVARRSSKIFCFEPIPKTFGYLKKNLALNPTHNIEAHNFGFSNKTGEFTFYYYPEGSGNASSANVTGRTDVETVQCEVRTLDDYTAAHGINGTHVDFIKCDVEGAELMVFQGGLQTIKRDLPIVFSEILRKWSAKFNYDPNDIFDFFRVLGYKSFTVSRSRLKEFNVMKDQTIETNFFFLHSVKHENQIRQLCI